MASRGYSLGSPWLCSYGLSSYVVMAMAAIRPIPGWRPSTPDIGCESFEDLDENSAAVAIHFWAPWNGVDPAMDQEIQQVADRFAGRVRFVSANIDTERGSELGARFGVANVPTIVVLASAAEPRLIVGHRGAEELATKIESKLSSDTLPRWWAFWRRDV